MSTTLLRAATNMISGAQARGGRALARLKIEELAKAAEVSPNTIVRFEADKGVNMTTIAAIQRALEAAGVEFTDGGVRLKVT